MYYEYWRVFMRNLVFLLPIVFVMSCTSDVAEDPVTWADTDITFHNEMMACTAGTDFSEDSVNAMMSEYRSLLSNEDLVGAWGYIPASAENRFDNGWWELSWTSKEAANAGWSEWNSNPDAQAWSEKHANVMECDVEGRSSWTFVWTYDPYAFGEFEKVTGSFASDFAPCSLNEGKSFDDFKVAINDYIAWLESLDREEFSQAYAYGLYLPQDENGELSTSDINFWWGNFHQSFESMLQGNNAWELTGQDAKASLDAVATCGNPDIYDSGVIYDPTNPNFS